MINSLGKLSILLNLQRVNLRLQSLVVQITTYNMFPLHRDYQKLFIPRPLEQTMFKPTTLSERPVSILKIWKLKNGRDWLNNKRKILRGSSRGLKDTELSTFLHLQHKISDKPKNWVQIVSNCKYLFIYPKLSEWKFLY